MTKRFWTAIAAVLFIAIAATGAVTIRGKGIPFEAGGTSQMIPIITIVTGTSDDTCTEVCALVAMDCQDAYVFAVAGASGDEFTDSAPSTDNADASVVLNLCN